MENITVNENTESNASDDYIINVDMKTMRYKTISGNSFFGMPFVGKYQEFVHRLNVNYIFPDDCDVFMNIFSADALKKSAEKNVRIISDEIRFQIENKIYYKNINAVVYMEKESDDLEIIISFLDITEKKKKKINEYSANKEDSFSKTHNLILNINLQKNLYSIAVANGNFVPERKAGIFTEFLEQFVSIIDADKKDYIFQQCQPETLINAFSSQKTELYFKFRIKKSKNSFLWMSMCIAAAPEFEENSSAFLVLKYMDSDEKGEPYMPADVIIDSRFDIFAARCLNILSVEISDTEKCIKKLLKNICEFMQADNVVVFTPEEFLPSVMRPAFVHYKKESVMKAAASLSGLDYAMEIRKLNESVANSYFMAAEIDDIAEIYPNIYNYLKHNGIEKLAVARINFGLDKKGFICIENAGIPVSDMENSLNLSAVFTGFAMDRLVVYQNKFSINSIRSRHNELLSLVYNRMHNGIVQFEVIPEKKSLKLLNFNDALCNIVGCDKEIIKNHFSKNFFRFAIDEDREKIFNALHLVASYQKHNSQTEVRIMNKTGDIKWVHINIFRIQTDDIRKIYIQAEFTDTTDIKHEQIEKNMVYDSMSGGALKFIVKNKKFEVISANDKFYEFFSIKSFDELVDIVGTKRCEDFLSSCYEQFERREPFDKHIHIKLKSGIHKWLNVSAKCIGAKSGYPLYMIVFIDITELEKAYTKLEKMNMELEIRTQRYNLIEEITNEKIVDYDIEKDRLIIQKNITNESDDEIIIENYLGKNFDGCFRNYICSDDLETYVESMKSIISDTGKGSFDYRSSLHHDGDSYKWYRACCTSISDSGNKRVRLIARVQNIENEKYRQKKIEIQIKSDPMTGLLNKVAAKSEISDVLMNEIPSDRQCHAMLIIDIDNFKSVNDNLGHMFGDAVLKNISSAIKRTFRSSDIIGRIGGDEFIVFMRNTDSNVVEHKADELCKSIKRCYSGRGRNIEVSCSIGIAYSYSGECDYDTLFNMADKAVYASKTDGKNRFTLYSENMTESNHVITREEHNHENASDEIHTDVILFALSLLANSRDINSSVSILLEQISNRYDISDIIVFESDRNGCMYSSNAWPENHYIAENALSFSHEAYLESGIKANSIICIDDCSECDIKLPFSMEEFKSYAAVAAGENAASGIFIVFGDRNGKRHWNDRQKNTLFEISKIISVFITLRNERNEDKKKIEMLRTTDALTGLYNFEAFKIKADKLIKKNKKNKKYAICYMDVNGFLYVNENFGYNAGDGILCDLAGCLKAISDDETYAGCACRVYSDYFIALVCAESRSSIMNKIKESNDSFFEIERKAYPAGSIGLSTGIYFIDDDFCDISIAIDNADLARKKAKRTNQNTYEIYTDELRTIRSNELSIIGELYRAMEKGRIELFLQPKFHLATRKIIGAEALARWRNDDCSLKYPSEFVPALEKIGYIVKLDFYMYEKVLESMSKWKNMGVELMPISVNFSRKNSMEDGFYERVYKLAEAYGIDRKYIEIETTESTFISDEESMLDTMGRFRNAGFKVDIDDFGTGYSSLSMLVSAPVDVVKIDKSFLKNIEDSQCKREYVKQMCKMIGTAKKDIIFEGVETEEQAQFLLECGFTKAQGFLFDKPIHISEFERKYLSIPSD
ncbi:MAG: EAL domain-containing protein [Oscillospiraceae bacterium]